MVARFINNSESQSMQRTQRYEPMDESQISLRAGFTVQVVVNATGDRYSFSVKDTICHVALFSDNEQIIYAAQPAP